MHPIGTSLLLQPFEVLEANSLGLLHRETHLLYRARGYPCRPEIGYLRQEIDTPPLGRPRHKHHP
jgi:hypothetical protein